MTSEKEKITFAVDGENFGNFKLREGDRRMKIYIKLSKDETQQWKALKAALTGGNLTDDTLARIMFFKGIHTITSELNERVENMTEEEKEAIMKDMNADQADQAMKLAEEELGVSDENATEATD